MNAKQTTSGRGKQELMFLAPFQVSGMEGNNYAAIRSGLYPFTNVFKNTIFAAGFSMEKSCSVAISIKI